MLAHNLPALEAVLTEAEQRASATGTVSRENRSRSESVAMNAIAESAFSPLARSRNHTEMLSVDRSRRAACQVTCC